MSRIYTTGTIPEDFKAAIIAIPKKMNAQTCGEHRILSILPFIVKILTIHRRIQNKIEENLPDEQFGFRKEEGTREVILSLLLIS